MNPKKSSKNKKFRKKICPPDSEVLHPPVIRSIASLALTIVWAPYLFFGNSTTVNTQKETMHIYISVEWSEVQIPIRTQFICFKISAPPASYSHNSVITGTPTVHCLWEDGTAMPPKFVCRG